MSSYEHPTAPRGFVYQIVILSTWSDQYYVGLNGIQMYDIQGRLILLSANSKSITNNYSQSKMVLSRIRRRVIESSKGCLHADTLILSMSILFVNIAARVSVFRKVHRNGN